MSYDWRYSFIDCFGNIGLCIRTYLLPCYTFGRNAQLMEKNCILYGLLYTIPPANLFLTVYLRVQIRNKYDISGSIPKDVITVICCPFCALVQEAQQLHDHPIEITIPRDMVINRGESENKDEPDKT